MGDDGQPLQGGDGDLLGLLLASPCHDHCGCWNRVHRDSILLFLRSPENSPNVYVSALKREGIDGRPLLISMHKAKSVVPLPDSDWSI